MQVCNEALALGQLTAMEEGTVHGVLGALYFEKAFIEADKKAKTDNLRESIRHYTSAIAKDDQNHMNLLQSGVQL